MALSKTRTKRSGERDNRLNLYRTQSKLYLDPGIQSRKSDGIHNGFLYTNLNKAANTAVKNASKNVHDMR